jgi:hypothetical protein
MELTRGLAMRRRGWATRLATSVVALLVQVMLVLPAFGRPCRGATSSMAAMPGMQMPPVAPYAASGDPMTPHRTHQMPGDHRPCTCPSTPAACLCGPSAIAAVVPAVGTLDVPTLVNRVTWPAVVPAPPSLTLAPATPPPKA